MLCPSCGKHLPEDAFFCAYCGALAHALPAPLPRVAFDRRAAGLALAGTAAALPVSAGFWLLAGQVLLMTLAQRLTIGALAAGLVGCLGAGLQAQLRWPLDAQPPRCSPRQLGLAYGIGGGLAVAIGAALVGAVVVPLAWSLGVPTIPSLLAGATSGLAGIAFALPPAVLVGAATGYALGHLAGGPRYAPWVAALAWWLAGSAGGGVVGAFVAARTNLAISTGAYLGAGLQSVLAVLMFPMATHLVRRYLILIN
jgi:hypothetical protein